MKTLKQLCRPRPSVFQATRSGGALDLSNLLGDGIDADQFFIENYVTDGMRRLITQAFRRFTKTTEQGVYVLTQQMGGGKTHSMIALGLLAQHPRLRQQVMPELPPSEELGAVRVVTFNGRESDAPLGIWGTIATQLEKKDAFKDYYSPLSAPGQSAWVSLLEGEPLLILFDELPPYLDNARAKTIGNSDLAQVTTTALANLLVAVGKQELSNVCVVISDLKASYEGGSQQISRALEHLTQEVSRSAVSLEPVAMNTDEVYHILRTRLFEQLPDKTQIRLVADAYAKAVRDARQMDLTNTSPDQFVQDICDSYPFHRDIRDLYARFRENQGFQQTRGLLRLMRVLVARIFDESEGIADKQYLIHAHDFDLNHRETLTEITEINPKLGNAIAHDIASAGSGIAEQLDRDRGTHTTDAQDVAKLLLVSSLSTVPNATLGLSVPDIVTALCAPHRDIARLPKEVIDVLLTRAWYLHTNSEGRLYFRDVKNLVAELRATAQHMNREAAKLELRAFLEKVFTPTRGDCYQQVQVLPAVDEINPPQDRVVLVLLEPYGNGLDPRVAAHYTKLDYPNRVLFLTGERTVLDRLLDTAAERKAIQGIIDRMRSEQVRDNDPQYVAARDMAEKITMRLLSTARETFTTLHFPSADGLSEAAFTMNFQGNDYKGEVQIRQTLQDEEKYTDDITGDVFQKKCEARLFTQKSMQWSEVLRRAATTTKWQWHHRNALNDLRDRMLRQATWREQGTYIEKGPFPPPKTTVQVRELDRSDKDGTVTLRIEAVHGDTLYYDVGAAATPASRRVENPQAFKTNELVVSFLCVDSNGTHDTGDPVMWRNTIIVKGRLFADNTQQRRYELEATPPAPIRYTTDGSDPTTGGVYDEPFIVPDDSRIIQAVAEKDDIRSDVHRYTVPQLGKEAKVEVRPHDPATWRRRHKEQSTDGTYTLLGYIRKHNGQVFGATITVTENQQAFVEFTCDNTLSFNADQLEGILHQLRGLLPNGTVSFDVQRLAFDTGQQLLDWIAEARTELRPGEVQQE